MRIILREGTPAATRLYDARSRTPEKARSGHYPFDGIARVVTGPRERALDVDAHSFMMKTDSS